MAIKARKGKAKMGRPVGSGVKGHVMVLVALRPDQRDEILERARSRQGHLARPPVSEVVRELLDAALKRRR